MTISRLRVFIALVSSGSLLSVSSHAAVLAYEGFGDAVDFGAIDGYVPGTASSGLTGAWTQHQGGTQTYLLNRTSPMAGITNGHAPNTNGGNRQWVEHDGWDLNRASATLSSPLDLSLDGTYYLSFFSRTGGTDVVTQLGLANGTTELMFGRGWNRGITSYYGPTGSSPDTNHSAVNFAPGDWDTLFYVAQLVKTNSGITDDLALNINIYNLTASGSIDSSADSVTWLRSDTFSGVDDTFTALQFKLDGAGAWPSMDEFRLGETWLDVTGVPEPSAAALLGLSGLVLVLRRRK